MIQRLYVQNFRCLENFELKVAGMSSALLIGRNGVGKSTIASALRIFQSIGRGVTRAKDLIEIRDFAHGRIDIPMRFEIEVLLGKSAYVFSLAFELSLILGELRVIDESLFVDGNTIYSRSHTKISRAKKSPLRNDAQFFVDWQLVALTVIQEHSATDPVSVFKSWLAKMVIIQPIPSLMSGESSAETLQPEKDVSNLGDWFSGLLSQFPSAYSTINDYLRGVMPDLSEIRNELIGKEAKRMLVQFAFENAKFEVRFDGLSDGEKCFFLCAVVLAANRHYGPLFCFWDEPDNFLSLSEVGHFIIELRKAFKNSGQILVTSHNEEAIRKFSSDNTLLLDRKNHLEPTLIRLLADLPKPEDLIQTLILGELTL